MPENEKPPAMRVDIYLQRRNGAGVNLLRQISYSSNLSNPIDTPSK